jgi:hypothetical protein
MLEKSELHGDFIGSCLENKYVASGIGGFPIVVHALPNGHRYLHSRGGYTYKIEAKWGAVTHQPIEQVYTGDGHFELSVVPSKVADVPVVGACLLQARRGYVFSPIERPEAFLVDLAPQDPLWKGREREMYERLNHALECHVAAVA